jgi:hypothetical protein
MSLDVICSGYLQKQGTSKGHRSISKKNRYFVLTDLFLYYYTEPPVRNTCVSEKCYLQDTGGKSFVPPGTTFPYQRN